MKNVQLRRDILKAATTTEAQEAIRSLCSKSLLIWINLFVWSYDPRAMSGTKTPFVTYQYQDEALLEMLRVIRSPKKLDITVEKTRDMGASWMFIILFTWLWLYEPQQVELFMMSHKESLVDGGAKSLFGKIDILLRHLPSWMMPLGFKWREHRLRLQLINPVTGSKIEGESTSSKSGVGGRYLAMFFDEFSIVDEAEVIYIKSGDCTNHRLFNGTPNGTHTTFFRLRSMLEEDGMKVIRMHWTAHPWKSHGLYYDDGGKAWSPWYLAECKRRDWNKVAIAQELDIDYQAASWQYFSPDVIKDLIEKFGKPPTRVGEIEEGQFKDDSQGRLQVWFDGQPVRGRYAIGCDVAAGVKSKGATPSCISVLNIDTGEKVAEWQDEETRPEQFAAIVRDIALYFHGGTINFEHLGPGTTFCQVLREELHYAKMYIRRSNTKSLMPETSKMLGWGPSKEGKVSMMESYRNALTHGRFLNRSIRSLNECLEFVFDKGSVKHSTELTKDNPAGQDMNHGDQVVADALAWMVAQDMLPSPAPPGGQREERPAPFGSPGWREDVIANENTDGW